MDILILLGLIGLSAIISTAEIGFFSVNETKLRALAQNGNKRAAKALELRSDPQKLLSTILVGDRLVGTAIPMFATFITLNTYGGQTFFD
jgi:putative hemolysin